MRGLAPLIAAGIAAVTVARNSIPAWRSSASSASSQGSRRWGSAGSRMGASTARRCSSRWPIPRSSRSIRLSTARARGWRDPTAAHAFAYNAWADALTARVVSAVADRFSRRRHRAANCARSAAQRRRRRRGVRRLRAGGLGDDADLDRRGRGPARMLRRLRRADRRRVPRRAVPRARGPGRLC